MEWILKPVLKADSMSDLFNIFHHFQQLWRNSRYLYMGWTTLHSKSPTSQVLLSTVTMPTISSNH